MQIFTSGAFWFVEGVLFVLVAWAFRAWMEDRGHALSWWKWMVVAAWVGLAGFTLAFVGTSLGEGEATAALRGGILFGTISIFAGVAVWRLITLDVSGEPDAPV